MYAHEISEYYKLDLDPLPHEKSIKCSSIPEIENDWPFLESIIGNNGEVG